MDQFDHLFLSLETPIWLYVAISVVIPIGFSVLALLAYRKDDKAWKTRLIVAGSALLAAAMIWASVLAIQILEEYPLQFAAIGISCMAIGWIILALFVFGRSRGRRRCLKCNYDMSGTTGLRCPECGWNAKRESRLFGTRRHWRLALLAILPSLLAAYLAALPTIRRDGWTALLPTSAVILALQYGDHDWALGVLEERVEADDFYANGFIMSGMWDANSLTPGQWRAIGQACIPLFEEETGGRDRQYLLRWLHHARDATKESPVADDINTLLRAHLDDEDPSIRNDCMTALVDPGNATDSIAMLRQFLNDESERPRSTAYYMLRHFVPDNEEATQLLLTGLEHQDRTTRITTLSTISLISQQRVLPPDVIERVRMMSSDPDGHVRQRRVQTLARIVPREERMAVIEQSLANDDAKTREGATWSLGALLRDEPSALNRSKLVQCLGDADAENRDIAKFLIEDYGIEQFKGERSTFEAVRNPNAAPETAEFIDKALKSFDETK